MIDLTTRYLGLDLRNPLVCSPSPLCQDLDDLLRMEEAGAAAVVLHSLFEEQIVREGLGLSRFLDHGDGGPAQAPPYLPEMGDYNLGPEDYLEHVREAKSLLRVPVIASLNGHTRGGWVRYARWIEEAGADALELNIYEVPAELHRTSAQVEGDLVGLVGDVAGALRIPVAVKLGPYYTAPAHLAGRLVAAGAKGLVLFNRFYQPDFDLERLDVVPSLWLSAAEELRLRLHWVALLHGRVHADFAITGGVHTHADVLKALMAGASVAMMTSALLRHGIGHLADVLGGLREWMAGHHYHAVRMLRGSMSFASVGDPTAFERANYLKLLRSHAAGPAVG